MDTYENDSMIPEGDDQAKEQPTVESESAEMAEPGETSVQSRPTEEETNETMPETETAPNVEKEAPCGNSRAECSGKKSCDIWKKVIFHGVSALLVLAMVIVGCGATALGVSLYWKGQNNALMSYFEERIDVLEQQLDYFKDRNNSQIIVTEEGLTADQIYQRNIDSVVSVTCQIQSTSMGQTYTSSSAGSGFVFSENGYIVTNHHVVEGAASISVTFADGTQMSAELIGSDSTNDIALLKVQATGLQAVVIGSSNDLKVGERVVAIGNALGELNFSLTSGVVSGIDRDITTEGTAMNMIQTDAAINSGNSGGPLFNAMGEVVGITSAKYSGNSSSGASIEGIGFAIPIDDVLGMLEDLRDYGYIRSAYMGITGGTAETGYGQQIGVQVVQVVSGGSADKAGIRSNDIITSIGGYEVTNMTDLSRALRQLEIGREYTITVLRSGQIKVLKITLDEKPVN